MEKGFLKSGTGLNNLIYFNYADVGYLGLGFLSFMAMLLISYLQKKTIWPSDSIFLSASD